MRLGAVRELRRLGQVRPDPLRFARCRIRGGAPWAPHMPSRPMRTDLVVRPARAFAERRPLLIRELEAVHDPEDVRAVRDGREGPARSAD